MLSPRYFETSQSLSENEVKKGMAYIEEEFPVSFLSKYFKLKAQLLPYEGTIMKSEVIHNMRDYEWWQSFFATNKSYFSKEEIWKTSQLMTAMCSSADIERVFSSFGQIHTKLRNRLGVERASKLCFLCKNLHNDTNGNNNN